MFETLYKVHMDKQSHLYFEKHILPVTDTLSRLQLKYLQYKSAFYLDELADNADDKALYRRMFTVDYTVDTYAGRYLADLSFSFLHWNLMEKLETNAIKVDQIDQDQF